MSVFILSHDEARRRARACVAEAPAGYIVKVLPGEKTRDQEKIAHSCYHDFAVHALIDGKRATDEDWKAKLKCDFFDETGADPEYVELWAKCKPRITHVPGTRYVVMSEIHSSDFPRKLYRAYITFLHAMGDNLGVTWSPTSLGREATADLST
jgi:hypothetical protein